MSISCQAIRLDLKVVLKAADAKTAVAAAGGGLTYLSTMSRAMIDVDAMLRPYAEHLPTRTVRIGPDLLASLPALFGELLPSPPWLLIADANTWQVAGERLNRLLTAAGISSFRHLAESTSGGPLTANDEAVAAASAQLSSVPANAVIAIGSGTINDIAKLASFRGEIPYAVVATAPSMNGYTSGVAALLSNGVKITLPGQPPVACIFDLDLVASAPYRMIAAGFGDLLSRSVSMADWRLSHHLLGTEYSFEAGQLMEDVALLIEGVERDLPTRRPEVIAHLSAALSLSGAAMSVAGSSAPSSGGEHLISHYLDMTAKIRGAEHDLHGSQVGVATVVTAALYERLLALDPATVDVAGLVREHLPWEEQAERIFQRFGPLAAAVLPLAKRAYPSGERLRERLVYLKQEWGALTADLRRYLTPASALRRRLIKARAPAAFSELGVDHASARRAVIESKDIRPRYSILHLAAELGMLERWSDELLADSIL